MVAFIFNSIKKQKNNPAFNHANHQCCLFIETKYCNWITYYGGRLWFSANSELLNVVFISVDFYIGYFLIKYTYRAAGRGLIIRLQSYEKAGLDLNQPDSTNRTALHVVIFKLISNFPIVVISILNNLCERLQDMLSSTFLDPSIKTTFKNHTHTHNRIFTIQE